MYQFNSCLHFAFVARLVVHSSPRGPLRYNVSGLSCFLSGDVADM